MIGIKGNPTSSFLFFPLSSTIWNIVIIKYLGERMEEKINATLIWENTSGEIYMFLDASSSLLLANAI